MGWTLLYIAFGAVAVWLLAEVLLQYKARLRWRLLAFGGFATVVVGVVLLSSVVVIALGAAAFAVGQTFVTLSYRRGFTAGWALGGMPGTSGRRREARPLPPKDAEPHLEVSDLRPEPPREPPAYRPEPLPDDTGQYGVYERDPHPANPPHDPSDQYAGADHADGAGRDGQTPHGGQDDGYGYGYGGAERYAHSDPYADPYAGVPSGSSHGGGHDGDYDGGHGGGYGGAYDGTYGGEYATAADGTQGAQGYAPSHSAGGYGPGGYSSDEHGGGYGYGEGFGDGYGAGHAADPYAGQTSYDGGWVPQQRADEPAAGQYGGHDLPREGFDDGGYGASFGTGHHHDEQRPRN